MIRDVDQFKKNARNTILACMQDEFFNERSPVKVKWSIHGNVEMLEDLFQDDIAEICYDNNCVITKDVFAIFDDEGWTSVIVEFIRTEHLSKYLAGLEKDRKEELTQAVAEFYKACS